MKFIFIILLISVINFAQQFDYNNLHFDYYGEESGLSNENIITMMEDSRGFLWLGTWNGLNRFDGTSFKKFYYNPRDSFSISDASIYSLAEDKQGNIWIGTSSGGLNKYVPSEGKFYRYFSNKNEEIFVIDLHIDSSGTIWIGRYQGKFSSFNPGKGQFTDYDLDPDYDNNISVVSIQEDQKNNLWLGTFEKGLFRLNKNTGEINHFEKTFLLDNGQYMPIRKVVQYDSTRLLIGTITSGVYVFDITSNEGNALNLINDSFGNIYVNSIHVDQKNKIWIGSYNYGLFLTDLNESEVIHYPNLNSIDDNSEFTKINTILQLKDGTVFVGTEWSWLVKTSNQKKEFSTIPGTSTQILSDSPEWVRSIQKINENILWIGADNGLFEYSFSDDILNRIDLKKYGIENEIPVMTICLTKDSNVWLGFKENGALVIDLLNNNTYLPNLKISTRDNLATSVMQIKESSVGDIWISTYGKGLFRFNEGMKRVRYSSISQPFSINYDYVFDIEEDREGNIWISTDGRGVNMFKADGSGVLSFKSDNENSISQNAVEDIYIGKNDDLWFATYGGGIDKLSKNGNIFRNYSLEYGLPDNAVYSILEDDNKNIWITSASGITKIILVKNSLNTYSTETGFTSRYFTTRGSFVDESGTFYLGNENEVVMFNPQDIKEDSNFSNTVLSDFKVFDKSILNSITDINGIKLNYDQNFFSIRFSLLNYKNPGKNKYRYKLAGVDEDWVYTDLNNARYTGIQPGKYTFSAQGANYENVWSDKELSLSIVITPPFWDTYWFKGLILLAVISIIYGLYRFRINQLLKVERIRLQIAGDLHDDVGSSLTRISVQSELLKSTIKNEKAESTLKQIGETSREVVSSLSDIVWTLDTKSDKIRSLTSRMRDFINSTLVPKNTKVNFSEEILEEKDYLPILIRQNVYLIFKEVINNIAKHSDADKVTVTIKQTKEILYLKIYENGKGFDPANVKKGYGLRSIEKRVSTINADYSISISEGISIELSVPLKK